MFSLFIGALQLICLPKNLWNFCAITGMVCEQLQYSCERHLSELATMNETGDSLCKCLALAAEFQDFEKRSKVNLLPFFILLHASNNTHFCYSGQVGAGSCYCWCWSFDVTSLFCDVKSLKPAKIIANNGHLTTVTLVPLQCRIFNFFPTFSIVTQYNLWH